MTGWRLLFGRHGDDPQPPKLDPPDVMAARVEAKRTADLGEWAKVKARTPDILNDKINRAAVDAALKAAGYRRVMLQGEASWLKRLNDTSFGIHASLKTLGGDDYYAPSQRLILGGWVTLHLAAKVHAHLMPSAGPHMSVATVDEREERGFVLMRSDVERAIAGVEAELLLVDVDAALARLRHRPDTGCGAGSSLSHLVALVLGADVAMLLDYDHLRRNGSDAGFLPYITNEMVAEALALAYLVQDAGRTGLDTHLG